MAGTFLLADDLARKAACAVRITSNWTCLMDHKRTYRLSKADIMPESSSEDEFYDCLEDVNLKYYSLAYPKERGKGVIFTDMKDANRKLRDVKGSRLKIFSDFKEAKRFASIQAEELYSPKAKEKPKLRRDVDPFPNVSQRDLNCLRVAIEKGNKETLRSMVWNNPRHLVTESDSPTVLQVRFRYNALHVAAWRGCTDIISYLLCLMDDPGFWRSLHPSAEDQTNNERRDRIVDMYLNSPETGNMETPLHFACKFGHTECVRVLLAHRLTNRTPINKDGYTPDQIICSRFSGEDGSPTGLHNKTREIDLALNERYVVLVNNDQVENPGLSARVEEPMSWAQLTQRLSNFSSLPPSDDVSCHSGGRIRAYAGPLSPSQADKFFHEWDTPPRVKRDLFAQLKLTDEEKGFERMGRSLSQRYKTTWREYWKFLNDYTDLSTQEGLNQLENYLEKQCPPATTREYEDDVPMSQFNPLNDGDTSDIQWEYREPKPLFNTTDSDEEEEEQPSKSALSPSSLMNTSSGLLSSLTSMLANLVISAPQNQTLPPHPSSTPLRWKDRQSPPVVPVFQSTPLPPSRRRVVSRPLRNSIAGGGKLVPVDLDVSRAVDVGEPGNLEAFPRVKSWRTQVGNVGGEASLSTSFV